MYMREALIIAGILLAGPVHAAPSPWLQEQTKNMHRIDGSFVSTDYGFSVHAPPETTQYVTNGGDANHGLMLILGEGREITIYPEYVDLNPGDAKPCRENQFPWEAVSTRVTAVGHLGGRRACIVTFTRGNTIRRLTQTKGTDRGAGIMYTLLLTTTAQWSRDDFLLFRRVTDSFKRTSVTPRCA